MKISLSKDWSSILINNDGAIYFRTPSVYYSDLKFLIIDSLKELSLDDTISKICNSFNFPFALVVKTIGKYILVVDRVNSIPIFYSTSSKVISDSYIIDGSKFRVDPISLLYFKHKGSCLNNTTLNKDCKTVQPGEKIIISTDSITSDLYFQYYHSYSSENDDLYFQLTRTYNEIVKELKDLIGNKRVVIPLSGGMDSRLILHFIKKAGGIPICYTYGKQGSEEVEISRQLAHEAKVEWHFVRYTKRKWKSWGESLKFSNYINIATNNSTIACLQEYGVLSELIEKKILHKGDIIAPGFSGDFLAGSHIDMNLLKFSKEDLINYLIVKHFGNKEILTKRIKSIFKEGISQAYSKIDLDSLTIAEHFNWKERQSKYINNALRVYEFFNLDWIVPLWDKRLIDFWLSVPYQLKENRLLYISVDNNILSFQTPYYKNTTKALNIKKGFSYRVFINYFKQLLKYDKSTMNWNSVLNRFNYYKATILGYRNIDGYITFKYIEQNQVKID